MKTVSPALAAFLGCVAMLSVATCPAIATGAPALGRAPIVIRVNRNSPAGRTADPASANTQVPANVLIADADSKEVSVPAGAAQAHLTFQLVNISAGDLMIKSVQTSCGCAIAELATLPLTVAPGASAPVTVTMNLTGKSGLVAKSATVTTDQGMKTLLARVRILPPVAGSRVTGLPQAATLH